MKQIIQNKIKEIEQEYDIKILFALESGSRAWGFPSMDSDFDVRFIYVRKLEDYLRINSKNEFLDFPINDELDINGWDLRKFLKHLYASNATPFEWMQSPTFYTKQEEYYNSILQLLPDFFCQQTVVHHYLGLVKKQILQLNSEQIKLKTFFYVIRSFLSAKYCLKMNHYPPMQIDKLLFLVEDDSLRAEIIDLIEIKGKGVESDFIQLSTVLFLYLHDLYREISTASKTKRKGAFNEDLLESNYLKLVTNANDRFFKTT